MEAGESYGGGIDESRNGHGWVGAEEVGKCVSVSGVRRGDGVGIFYRDDGGRGEGMMKAMRSLAEVFEVSFIL